MGLTLRLGSLLVGLLCFATIGLFSFDGRFQAEHEGILANLDFTQGTKHWQGRPYTRLISGENGTDLALWVGPEGQYSFLVRWLTDAQRFTYVRVKAKVKVKDVDSGADPWQKARILLWNHGTDGKPMRHWPHEVITLGGSGEWQHVEKVIPVSRETERMRLVLYIGGTSGTLWVRDLAMDAVVEKPIFKVLRPMLALLWLSLGAWVAIALFSHRPVHWMKRLTVLAAVATLLSTMAPQPQLSNAVHTVVSLLRDAMTIDSKPATRQQAVDVANGRGALVNESRSAVSSAKEGNVTKNGEVAEDSADDHASPKKRWRHFFSSFDLQNVGHFVAFTVLALLGGIGYRHSALTHIAAVLLLFALGIEMLQNFSMTRSPQLVDGVLNVAGILSGLAVAAVWRQRVARSAAPTHSL